VRGTRQNWPGRDSFGSAFCIGAWHSNTGINAGRSFPLRIHSRLAIRDNLRNNTPLTARVKLLLIFAAPVLLLSAGCYNFSEETIPGSYPVMDIRLTRHNSKLFEVWVHVHQGVRILRCGDFLPTRCRGPQSWTPLSVPNFCASCRRTAAFRFTFSAI
jgi:hypothetical protein